MALFGFSACSFSPQARKVSYYNKGQSAFANKRYGEAAIYLIKAVRIDPGYTDAHELLAETFLNLKQPANAYKEFSRTLELRPNDYRTRLAMVNLLISGRDFKDAQTQVDLLMNQRPADPAVHMALSSLQAEQGKIPAAISEVQKTISLAPDRWEIYLALGILQSNSSDPNSAEESFKKVVEMNPTNPQARILLGNYYWARQRFSDAEQQYRQTIALATAAFVPRDALAQLYVAEGKPQDAEEVLKQAIHDMPNTPDSYLALSEFYVSNGDAAKALDECAALYHLHPNDTTITERYIALLIATAHYDEAHRLNEAILKRDANNSEGLVSRGRMQMIAGDTSGAMNSFQAALKNSPNDAEAHFLLGEANHARGDLVHDQSEWLEAAKLNPNKVQVQRELARVALRQGNMMSLLGYANQIIRLAPRSSDGYALRALCAISERHLVEAEADVQKAIAVNPADAFGHVQEGNLRSLQSRYSDAEKAYEKALECNPNSADALRGLLNSLVAQRQVDKAIAAAKAQVAKSPGNPVFYNLLGNALFQLKGDLPDAEAVFKQSFALNRSNPETVADLCIVKATKGDLDAAIATGEQFLKENPNEISVLLLMGSFHQSKAEWQRAQEIYQTVLSVEPLNPTASNELARVQLEMGGNPDRAIELAQTAIKALPQTPRVYDTLGWAYYQKRIYPVAINNFKQAMSLQEKDKLGDNPDVHYHLALAYARTGQSALARQQFLRVLQLNPNYRNAAIVQKELGHPTS